MANNNNCLKTSYETYTANSVKKLVEQIPEDRRSTLVEEILARANLFGCENEAALQKALLHLNGKVEKKEGEKMVCPKCGDEIPEGTIHHCGIVPRVIRKPSKHS